MRPTVAARAYGRQQQRGATSAAPASSSASAAATPSPAPGTPKRPGSTSPNTRASPRPICRTPAGCRFDHQCDWARSTSACPGSFHSRRCSRRSPPSLPAAAPAGSWDPERASARVYRLIELVDVGHHRSRQLSIADKLKSAAEKRLGNHADRADRGRAHQRSRPQPRQRARAVARAACGRWASRRLSSPWSEHRFPRVRRQPAYSMPPRARWQ